jgi:hypothetical protein
MRCCTCSGNSSCTFVRHLLCCAACLEFHSVLHALLRVACCVPSSACMQEQVILSCCMLVITSHGLPVISCCMTCCTSSSGTYKVAAAFVSSSACLGAVIWLHAQSRDKYDAVDFSYVSWLLYLQQKLVCCSCQELSQTHLNAFRNLDVDEKGVLFARDAHLYVYKANQSLAALHVLAAHGAQRKARVCECLFSAVGQLSLCLPDDCGVVYRVYRVVCWCPKTALQTAAVL